LFRNRRTSFNWAKSFLAMATNLFFHAEAIFAPVEVAILAEFFGIYVVGCGLLIFMGVIFFV